MPRDTMEGFWLFLVNSSVEFASSQYISFFWTRDLLILGGFLRFNHGKMDFIINA